MMSIQKSPREKVSALISGVYLIYNRINHKRYIGSTKSIERRFYDHRQDLQKSSHCNRHLQCAWILYGAEVFEFKVLLYCGLEDLLFYEQRALNVYGQVLGRESLYNMCPTAGSCLGRNLSQEHRAKIGKAHLGKRHSPETRAKLRGRKRSLETCARISRASKGRRFSPEARAKMSKAKIGHKVSPETRAKISAANKGRTRSPEIRAKISIEVKNRSPEWRAKLSVARKGRITTPETRAKMSATHKQIWVRRRAEGIEC